MKNFARFVIACAALGLSYNRAAAQFFDDFNDGNANGWAPLNSHRWRVESQSGSPAYCLFLAGATGDEYSVLSTQTWNNFTLELDVKSNASDNQNYFILFGAANTNNLNNSYYLQFAPTLVKLYKVFIEGPTPALLYTASGSFASDNQYHRLRIVRQAPAITVYVDNQLLFQVSDGSYVTGYIGFGSYQSTVCVDNVAITTPTAQTFTDISAALTGASGSSVAWGDYDNDNNLDILLAGRDSNGSEMSRVYRNEGSSIFALRVTSLLGVRDGSVAWGDYDNDGYVDILLTGDASGSGTERFTEVYHNNRTGTFSRIFAGLPGTRNGTAAWGDYDNDGDLDILLTGSPGTGVNLSEIYRNTAGTFAPINANLINLAGGSTVAWGDYDNDGDLDILMAGQDISDTPVTFVYKNSNGSFANNSANLAGVLAGSVAWGDYNSDSYLDILLAGRDRNGNRIAKVYLNNKNETFSDINAGLTGVENGSAVWGDYDNDGDLDILLTGTTTGTGNGASSRIYRNDNGSFISLAGLFTDVYESAAAWGDYDKDGDLDIVLTGEDMSGSRVVKVYRNDGGTQNTVPTTPTNLGTLANGNSLTFSWSKASDVQTSPNALTYNLHVGTTPRGGEIFSPMADPTGFRRVPQLGNMNHRNSWTIKNLQQGATYYWSVQAIDNAFAGSLFAAEQMVTVPVAGTAPTVTTGLATNVSTTSATLNGAVNPNNLSTAIKFQYGATTSYGNEITATPSEAAGSSTISVSANLTGLATGAAFNYRIIATNSAGTTTGTNQTFFTGAAPTAITNAATNVTTTSATLNATVNPNGFSTTVKFQYGTTTSYGSEIMATPSPVAGASVFSAGAALAGLAPNTAFHYRVVATNSAGTSNGDDQTFTTTTLPLPTVTTNDASNISASSATLNGTVNPNNLSTTVIFEYGTTMSYGNEILASPSPVNGTTTVAVRAQVMEFLPNTSYHYRVAATNDAGTTRGANQSFSTTGVPPAATTNAATDINANSATLNGTVNPNGLSTSVKFQYGTSTSYGSETTARPSPVTGDSAVSVNAALTGLATGTVFHYRVVATNSAGTTNGMDQALVTGAAPTVSTDAATDVTTTSSTLRATVNPNGLSATVKFQYGTTTSYGSETIAMPSPITGANAISVSTALTGLASGVIFHYRAVATNSAGTTNGADQIFVTGAAPMVTTNAATEVGTNSATLNGMVNPNGLSTSIRFQYGTTASYGDEITATPSPASGVGAVAVKATLSTLIPNTLYHYRLVGENNTGITHGDDQTFTTTNLPLPTVTTNEATNITSISITLNGTVNPNNLSTTVMFEYGMSTSYGNQISATPSPVNGAATIAVSSRLTGLLPNTSYHYRVVATNNAGRTEGANRSFTTTESGSAPAVVTSAATHVTTASATLNAMVNPNGLSATVKFQYGVTTSYGSEVAAMPSPVTGTDTVSVSAVVTSLAPNTLYHYRAVGTNSVGTTNGAEMTFTTSPIPNRPPLVWDPISDRTLIVGDLSFRRDLNATPPVFNDPDGDALEYTARSSAPNIATASLSASTLTVAPVAPDSATITITAYDNKGGMDSTTFVVTVILRPNQPPAIVVTPLAPQPSGQQIAIQANLTDDTGIASAALNYRRGGEIGFASLPMTLKSGSTYEAITPAGISDSRGIEYFILAKDVDGAETRNPESPKVISLPILVSIATKPTVQPGGSALDAYRLVSVSFQLDNTSAADVLVDDLGAYDSAKWRLFGLAAGEPFGNKAPYVEVSQTGIFAPGKSLFLIVKEANKQIDAGPGRSLETDEEFRITLVPGHNFIASPFNFIVGGNNLRLQSNGAIVLRTYTGSWVSADSLTPWEGYYLANNSTSADILFINPNLPSGLLSSTVRNENNDVSWRIQIFAHCDETVDTENFAGVASRSDNGWDDKDLVEPPPIGEYVSLYFPHPEWQKPLDRYSDDMRSPATLNQRWDFVVESNISREMVTLEIAGLQEVEPALAVYLVDEELNYKQNLREQTTYEYQSRGLDKPKRLSLVVGKEEYVSDATANTAGVPKDFVLEQNFPNPFNPETAIRFGLPQQSTVTLRIYDLAGREVATVLEHVELPAGRHQRVWDGRDASGHAVSNGVYFCRLTAPRIVRVMKMAVLK